MFFSRLIERIFKWLDEPWEEFDSKTGVVRVHYPFHNRPPHRERHSCCYQAINQATNEGIGSCKHGTWFINLRKFQKNQERKEKN